MCDWTIVTEEGTEQYRSSGKEELVTDLIKDEPQRM